MRRNPRNWLAGFLRPRASTLRPPRSSHGDAPQRPPQGRPLNRELAAGTHPLGIRLFTTTRGVRAPRPRQPRSQASSRTEPRGRYNSHARGQRRGAGMIVPGSEQTWRTEDSRRRALRFCWPARGCSAHALGSP